MADSNTICTENQEKIANAKQDHYNKEMKFSGKGSIVVWNMKL